MTSKILNILPPTDVQSLDVEMAKRDDIEEKVTQHKLNATKMIRARVRKKEAETSHLQQKDMEAHKNPCLSMHLILRRQGLSNYLRNAI